MNVQIKRLFESVIRRLSIAVFFVGFAGLAAWVTGSILWIKHIDIDWLFPGFFIAAAAIMFLFGLGLSFRAKDRWLAILFASILLTGLSLSWAYSLGGFLWPVGLVLLVISLAKLRQYRAPKEPVKT